MRLQTWTPITEIVVNIFVQLQGVLVLKPVAAHGRMNGRDPQAKRSGRDGGPKVRRVPSTT